MAETAQLMENGAAVGAVDAGKCSRALVAHVQLCREPNAVSTLVVGLYNGEPLVDRRE